MGFLKFSYNELEIICGILFFVTIVLTGVVCALALLKIKRMRVERFKKASREVSFALPDRENAFVRERLRSGLRPESEREEQSSAVLMKDLDVRLDYTRKTVAKLKTLELTPADRLEVNRISKTVTFYALKNALSPSETRSLNDCFARLLKLTTKYAI